MEAIAIDDIAVAAVATPHAVVGVLQLLFVMLLLLLLSVLLFC